MARIGPLGWVFFGPEKGRLGCCYCSKSSSPLPLLSIANSEKSSDGDTVLFVAFALALGRFGVEVGMRLMTGSGGSGGSSPGRFVGRGARGLRAADCRS